jgi:formamidopyrimidine-DNA glycosylase
VVQYGIFGKIDSHRPNRLYYYEMPELPEVETIVRELRQQVAGKTIARVRLHWERSVQGQAKEFTQRLAGMTISAISRRGKFIGFGLHDGAFFTIHLRMTGKLVQKLDADGKKHVRVEFRFRDGSALYFVDARKFGRLRLWPSQGQSCPGLGPEPLKPAAVLSALTGLRTRRPIKTVLLDQTILAGVGNIYADESLSAAGIHPLTPAARLSADQRLVLSCFVPKVLKSAIRRCGTTLRDYRTVAGRSGENQEFLQVYGRANQPCFACGVSIEKIRVSGRSAHFCPCCQKMTSVTGGEGRKRQ